MANDRTRLEEDKVEFERNGGKLRADETQEDTKTAEESGKEEEEKAEKNKYGDLMEDFENFKKMRLNSNVNLDRIREDDVIEETLNITTNDF